MREKRRYCWLGLSSTLFYFLLKGKKIEIIRNFFAISYISLLWGFRLSLCVVATMFDIEHLTSPCFNLSGIGKEALYISISINFKNWYWMCWTHIDRFNYWQASHIACFHYWWSLLVIFSHWPFPLLVFFPHCLFPLLVIFSHWLFPLTIFLQLGVIWVMRLYSHHRFLQSWPFLVSNYFVFE